MAACICVVDLKAIRHTGKLLKQIIQVLVTEDYGLFKGKTNTVSFAFDILAYYHADIDAAAGSGVAGDP